MDCGELGGARCAGDLAATDATFGAVSFFFFQFLLSLLLSSSLILIFVPFCLFFSFFLFVNVQISLAIECCFQYES